jgi:Double zinc ribbon
MKCPHCKSKNPDGAIFCGDCGKTIVQAAAETTSLEDVFKWIGIGVVALIILGMLQNC